MRLLKGIVAMVGCTVLVGLLAACGSATAPTPTSAAEEVPPVPQGVTGAAVVAPNQATAETAPATTAAVAALQKEKPELGGTWDYDRGVPIVHDPYVIQGPNDLNIFNSLFQMKFPFDAAKGIEFEPSLATEYSTSGDGTKLRVKLRQGVTWHDGEVFNADDVVATTQRLVDKDFLLNPQQVAMRDVWAGIKKLDDYTVELDTGTPDATALTFIRSYEFPMVPEHLIKGVDPVSTDVNKRWKRMGVQPGESGTFSVGTGPFKVTEWKAETELIGVKNPNYFKFDEEGNRLPYMDRIRYRQFNDPIRRIANFVAGSAEYSMGAGAGLTRRDAQGLCSQARFPCSTLEWPHGWIIIYGNGKSTPIFQNPKVNAAHRYGHDMDAVVDTAYAGGSSWMWVDPEYYPQSTLNVKEQYEVLPWSNPARRAEFNQKAKELMAQAGYPDGVDLPYPYYAMGTSNFRGCSGSFLDQYTRHTDQLRRIGFKTFLECREGVNFLDEIRSGRFSIGSHSQPIRYVDPGTGILQSGQKTSGLVGGQALAWLGVEESDAAYRVIQKTLDPSKQNELYKQYERLMANPELVLFPSFYSRVLLSFRDCVHNYAPGGVWATHQWSLERVWLTEDCRK